MLYGAQALIIVGGALYGILYFILTYTLDHLASVSDIIFCWGTTLPYLALLIWLSVTLLARRDLFTK